MRMPALFIGHGSPMIAIEENKYTDEWRKIGERYKPKAILVLSAHWFTEGNRTQDTYNPEKINDMYGFPEKISNLTYPVHGDKQLTNEIVQSLEGSVRIDNSWGIDHGTWSILVHMYPKADIPIVQLSVAKNQSPKEQFLLGQKISHLRNLGYMILGSGNVVHNLRKISPNVDDYYDWVASFDDYIEDSIRTNQYDRCINYLDYGPDSKLSVPTPDHFYPLLNILGTVSDYDHVTVFNKGYTMGGLSMTSYLFDEKQTI